VIKTALIRIANDASLALDEGERNTLRKAGPHAFRHTFGTQAVAGDVPLDVLQRVLGHASLQTTTIYVQAEKRRSIDELGKFFRK
jgi:integrase